jgi:hypothetical protein
LTLLTAWRWGSIATNVKLGKMKWIVENSIMPHCTRKKVFKEFARYTALKML